MSSEGVRFFATRVFKLALTPSKDVFLYSQEDIEVSHLGCTPVNGEKFELTQSLSGLLLYYCSATH